MIPNGIVDTFQPRSDFSYGLDVEIRPKLTPGAGTQVQYSIGCRAMLIQEGELLYVRLLRHWISASHMHNH